MNRKVLLISPYFPPSNAADMHRLRMSLPFYERFGWDAEVVTVEPGFSEMSRDELLLQSIPTATKIHFVKAFDKTWTSIFGLGSLALRSIWYYSKKVNHLLRHQKYDLICFSTTQFPVCILGAYWKKKFGIPYVIDMQDPWHSDYYRDKPKSQQPAKYWFSYRLNKYLEPLAMKKVDGLMAVSANYITVLKNRYPEIKQVPQATIIFGAAEHDLEIAKKHANIFPAMLQENFQNIVYIGRGGHDLHKAIKPVFSELRNRLARQPELYGRLKFYFIGTSYAPAGFREPSIMPLAKQYNVEANVVEVTGRIGFYHTLAILTQAAALFIPGSDDPNYTASKIYPCLLTNKPMLAIFNSRSPALDVLKDCGVADAYSYDETSDIQPKIGHFLEMVLNGTGGPPRYNKDCISGFSAGSLTGRQCELFDRVIEFNRPDQDSAGLETPDPDD